MFWVWLLAIVLFYNFVFKYLVSLVRIKDVESKAILITGCDSGFGRELALRCLRHGFRVFAGCLTQEGQDTLKKEAGLKIDKLFTFSLNICSDESVKKARQFVEENLSNHKFYALVNNAGVSGAFSPDAFCTIETYQSTFDVNFFGLVRVTHAFSPLLKRDSGRIVNMASVNGKIALPYTAPYCASKCAVNGYSDVLRREMRPFGVKVLILEPSFYKTPLMALKPLNEKIDKMYNECREDEKQFYGPEFVTFLKNALDDIDVNFCSEKTYQVVDAYFDALTCVWPELRYHPGFHAKVLFIPAQFLSSYVQDLLHRLLTLAGPQPPAPLKPKSN